MTGTAEKNTLQQEPETLVKMSGVDVINDGNLILSNVDITIGKGEFVYLLGKVGSGKSSIIKTLIAELPLKKGKAEVAGFNLWKIKKRHIPFLRRKLGVVFQDFQLLMDRSVEDNLLFVLEATGWKKRKLMHERVMEVLEMVGMQEKIHKMPHQLSGGEQQRIAIARALLNNPQVILADEPTGNLDEETATEIMNVLTRIHAQEQPAVLMVTHNRELYKRYPGRVLICEDGGVREMEQEIEFSPFDLPEPAVPAEPAAMLEVLPDTEPGDALSAAPAAMLEVLPDAEPADVLSPEPAAMLEVLPDAEPADARELDDKAESEDFTFEI